MPAQWANTETSRITVAECFGFQIWIIANCPVLKSLGSPASRRVYEYAIDQLIAGYCSEPRLASNGIVVVHYRGHLQGRGLAGKHHQPTTRIRAPPISRGRPLGLAESRVGIGSQPSEGNQAAWVSFWQLVERGAKF